MAHGGMCGILEYYECSFSRFCLFVQMKMKNGVWKGQGCEGAKLSLAIHSLWPLCLINGPRSYTLLHQRVCHSLIMWPSVAQLMTLEE